MENKNRVGRSSVLVVEDDRSITRMLRFCLEAAGFGITEVATGTEALNLLETQSPQAVVLDLNLPDGQGAAVLDRLRQYPIGLPAWIAISGLGRREATSQYGPLGQHFLAKPFDPWDLIGILEDMISRANEHRAQGHGT